MIHALAEARDPAAFGGKAVQLGVGIRAGLPVPAGFAVSADHVEAVVCTDAEADADAVAALRAACVDGAVRAVRSSAIGEDSGVASFAGAHLTVLGVRGAAAIVDAVRKVHASGLTAGARAYRDRLRLAERPRMAVVVQELIDADVAGVLFTGRLLERRIGEKDLAVRRSAVNGTEEVSMSAARAAEPCLGAAELDALHGLAAACDSVYGPDGHDIEFAFRGGAVFLLQRRPITSG